MGGRNAVKQVRHHACAAITLRASKLRPSTICIFPAGSVIPILQPTLSSEYDGSIEKRFGEIGQFHRHLLFPPHPQSESSAEPNPAVPDFVKAAEYRAHRYAGCRAGACRLPVQGLSLSGNFTVLDATHSPHNPLPTRVPKHSAAGVAQYKASRPGPRR